VRSACIILGEEEGLSDELREAFRRSGLYHVLTMDGQNKTVRKGRAYRPGQSQQRNREFAALIKALYDGE
jgi:hypothetical protein